jgi:two-component system, chemotaxis family, CheB/CheR fusion protein
MKNKSKALPLKLKHRRRPPETPTTTDRAAAERDGSDGPFPIVGVGASAGGLEAFTELLGALPIDTGMGFVLVQHLDPDHESALTQILARATSLPVHEITNDEPVRANHVYIIPPDTNLTIAKGVLRLQPRQRTRVLHRPIDSFFESLAQDQRERAVGVVLSGTANDGTMGLEAIKAEGGITFAQDDSAKYDSMPRSASAAGCVDLVLSPAEIAKELARIAKHPYVAGQPLQLYPRAQAAGAEATEQEIDDTALPSGGKDEAERDLGAGAKSPVDGYKSVLLLLRNHSGVDFSLYKSTTIQRRIARRLVVNRQDSLADYAGFLRGNAKELDALYADVLISVTSFFRNPETFDVLQHRILPELLRQRGDDPLRCWVLGCASGQEAYSIAMAFLEAAEKAPRMRQLQIFATDLNDALLEKARHGLYAKSLSGDITPERLRRFFVEENGGYRVCKTLREMVIFARQNLIADPPFSRMDLISCRNLLIYLEPSLQRKAILTFHYALKPQGFLLLGASESVGGFTELFEPVDKKNKIYSRKPAPTQAFYLPVKNEHGGKPLYSRTPLPMRQPMETGVPEDARVELNAEREADRITVNQFAPPAVLVNAALQVLQFRGQTGAFLEPPTGKASFDLLKMAREGLMLPLRSAIGQARKEHKTARKNNIRLTRNGKTRTVNVEVIPLKNLRELCFLILFEEGGKARGGGESPEPLPARASRPRGHAESTRIAELEAELSETREYLQSMQEQHDAANEELQSANEEVQSANEEMQSVNEELETSKEELESTNEELTTVNEEMSNRNVELNRLNNDLTNLQNSTKLAIVLLGRDLTIRHFTPQAEKQFALHAADLGRPIRHIQHNLVFGGGTEAGPDLEGLGTEVISSVREQEHQVHDKNGRWLSLNIRPYITLESKVDGVVLVLVDISDRKRAEEADTHLAAIVSSSDDAIISKDLAGTIQSWNLGAQRLFGYTAEEAIGKPTILLLPPDRADEEPKILERVWRGETVDHYETVRQRKDGSLVDISLTVSPMRDATGRVVGAAKIARDIADRKRVEDALRQRDVELSEGEERRNEFLAMLGHELRNPLSALVHGLELMGQELDDRTRSEELRAMMVRQTTRIGILLDQLLDMARVISGKVVLLKERVELADVIQASVETARLFAEIQKQTLTVTLPSDQNALIIGDAIRLTQIVENLVTNAIKYTNDGGQIGVTLESDGDKARIIVRDTGVGMAADFLPHIFELFTQAQRSLDRAKGGMGLGLPLVRRLVEMHGGHVDASSPGLGQGSEFVVTLPRLLEVRPVERLEIAPAQIVPGRGQSRRILVVDDEKDAAEGLALLLKRAGHQTLAVNDGPAALAAIGTFDPEVVLLDLGLPKMDGYEVARRLRQEHGDKKILVCAVTGYQNDAARLKHAGFDEFLMKPPNMQKLSAILATWDTGGSARA